MKFGRTVCSLMNAYGCVPPALGAPRGIRAPPVLPLEKWNRANFPPPSDGTGILRMPALVCCMLPRLYAGRARRVNAAEQGLRRKRLPDPPLPGSACEARTAVGGGRQGTGLVAKPRR